MPKKRELTTVNPMDAGAYAASIAIALAVGRKVISREDQNAILDQANQIYIALIMGLGVIPDYEKGTFSTEAATAVPIADDDDNSDNLIIGD